MRPSSISFFAGLALAGVAACSGAERGGPAGQPTAPAPSTSGAAAAAAPTLTPAPAPSEPVVLAGGYLSARLPAGELVAPEDAAPSPDILGVVTHRVQRPAGTLRVESLDLDQRVTPEFAADAEALERAASCPDETAPLRAEPAFAAPEGFAVVTYFPTDTCLGGSPPEARLFVGTPDGVMLQVELLCEEQSACLPDRTEVLAALVASFDRAAPPSSAGGPRFLGPSPDFGLSLVIPEGFVVRHFVGEDSEMFTVARPAHVAGPADWLSVAFYFSSSPNTLREDYADARERARTVRGRVAGREVRFLELTGASRRRSIARLDVSGVMIDVIVQATTDEVRAQLTRALAEAVLRDPDAEEAMDEGEPEYEPDAD